MIIVFKLQSRMKVVALHVNVFELQQQLQLQQQQR